VRVLMLHTGHVRLICRLFVRTGLLLLIRFGLISRCLMFVLLFCGLMFNTLCRREGSAQAYNDCEEKNQSHGFAPDLFKVRPFGRSSSIARRKTRCKRHSRNKAPEVPLLLAANTLARPCPPAISDCGVPMATIPSVNMTMPSVNWLTPAQL
jgi:hypothetical protein